MAVRVRAYQAGSNSTAILAPFRFPSESKEKRDEPYPSPPKARRFPLSPIAEHTPLRIGSHCSLHQSCTITGLFPRSPPVGRDSIKMKAFEAGEKGVWGREKLSSESFSLPNLPCASPTPAEHWDASSKCRRDRRRSRCRIRCTDWDRKHTDTRRPPVFPG